MKVDLVLATFNRADTLRETLANVTQYGTGLNKIFVINNGSTDHTLAILDSSRDSRIVAIHNDRNLGAAKGKNIGLRLSDADIIIVIDDDAVFCTNEPVAKVRRFFEQYSKLGVVQFKIINFQTHKVLENEFPGPNPESRADCSFEIGYFIGAGHAIRKAMLERVGYYPDDFGLYAHEEIDLSYRAVNYGYVMRYEPSVAVYHKKAAGGRLPAKDVLHSLLLNRLLMTRRYLPWPYSLVNTALWMAKTVHEARSFNPAISAYLEYLQRRSSISRQLLSREALWYMRRNYGRLFK
jgi:GT2 family glycosyltransferase